MWSGGKATAASPVQPVRLQQKDGVPVPETNVMALEGLGAGARGGRGGLVIGYANLPEAAAPAAVAALADGLRDHRSDAHRTPDVTMAERA